MGELPYRGALRRGHHEVGDVVMAPAPLIASGTVTVDGARPDVPVGVRVEFQDDDLTWQLDSGLVGILGAVTFYF